MFSNYYNRNLANQAVNLFNNRNPVGIDTLGVNNQAQNNLQNYGGLTFAPNDPMAIEKGNQINNPSNTEWGLGKHIKGSAITGFAKNIGFPSFAATALGAAFSPITGLAALNNYLQNTTWGKSKTLAAYLAAKRAAKKKQARIDAGYDEAGNWTSPSGRDHAGTGGIGSPESARGGAPGTSKGEGGWKG